MLKEYTLDGLELQGLKGEQKLHIVFFTDVMKNLFVCAQLQDLKAYQVMERVNIQRVLAGKALASDNSLEIAAEIIYKDIVDKIELVREEGEIGFEMIEDLLVGFSYKKPVN